METLKLTKEMTQALQAKPIHFSHNWNNKLNCNSFSTIRLWNEKKYQLLDIYRITLHVNSKEPYRTLGFARLQSKVQFMLTQLTPSMSFIDTNLNRIDFMTMFQKMYINKNINWKVQPLGFYVLQYLSVEEILSLVENLR